MEETFRKAALEYHEQGRPGKISIAPTKMLSNQRDLALAYSPGVAAACEEIVADPANAFRYTARGNLVGVITNGTAVLGLGNIGPLASKPVMEGKAVLFKKFAGIDVFDIEINEQDPLKLVEIIAGLEPTFGGINLEDIKAPECFIVERKLRERMRIPVFHDDQHGTAICVSAAFINGLKVVGKEIDKVKVVVSGAGAAALACLDTYVAESINDRVQRLGPVLRRALHEGLSAHPAVGDIRGEGFLLCIELVKPGTQEPLFSREMTADERALQKRLAAAFLAEGLLVFMRLHYVFVAPPLVVSEADMADGVARLVRGICEGLG